jgi:Maltooligosyl trehalose synthase
MALAPAGDAWLGDLRERLNAYLMKAMREAKVSTSWTDPDAEYEGAISRFMEQLLDAESNDEWMREVDRFVAAIAPQAMWNSLGRLVTHLLAPGVPDVYRGDELWFSALVDPDNRRPVDWRDYDLALGEVMHPSDASARLRAWRDQMDASRMKMLITARILNFRRESGAMMSHSDHIRLEVSGRHRESVFAFRRSFADRDILVLVPRLTRRLGENPVGEAWGDTRVMLPPGSATQWRCLIHDDVRSAGDDQLRLADVFSILPVAALVSFQG